MNIWQSCVGFCEMGRFQEKCHFGSIGFHPVLKIGPQSPQNQFLALKWYSAIMLWPNEPILGFLAKSKILRYLVGDFTNFDPYACQPTVLLVLRYTVARVGPKKASQKKPAKKSQKKPGFFWQKKPAFFGFFWFQWLFFSNFKVFLEFLIFLLTPNRYLSQKTNLCTLFKQVELNMWIYLSSFDDVSLPTCQSYTLILLYTFLSFMTKQ